VFQGCFETFFQCVVNYFQNRVKHFGSFLDAAPKYVGNFVKNEIGAGDFHCLKLRLSNKRKSSFEL
jgi:hypothetical protein